MEILPVKEINVDIDKIKEIDKTMQSTFRLITFSRQHKADDLLNAYLSSTANLKELLSIKMLKWKPKPILKLSLTYWL